MVIKMNTENLGTIKVVLERLASYISIINFCMILYMYTIKEPLGISWFYWFIIIIAIIPIIIVIDWKIIFPAALSITFGKKNKEFIEMKNDIKEIKEWVKK